jgi:hypothetical protein
MRLREAQSRALLRAHGTYVKEVCDKFGAVLGPIRWTIRGVPGAWCSRACRDGVDHNPGACRGCGTSLVGMPRGANYCGRTCRMRTVRREGRDCANIVNTSIQKTGVTDVISRFGYGRSRTARNATKQPRIEVNHECQNTVR